MNNNNNDNNRLNSDRLYVIAGIDYSITSPALWTGNTGYALTSSSKRQGNYNLNPYDPNPNNLNPYSIHIDAYPKYKTDTDRHRYLADWALDILTTNQVTHVILEGYSYGSKGRSVFQIGEATGCLKQALRNAHINCEIVTPTQVKKHATGSGGADKRRMIGAFADATGIDLFDVLGVNPSAKTIGAPVTDLVDAYWVSQMPVW